MKKSITLQNAGSGKTDWERIRKMTDEEAHQNALDDPDNPPLNDAQLAAMRRIPFVKFVRRMLGMTQEQFAESYHIPLGTLRDWEQGRTEPDQAAQAYLQVIEQEPEAVLRALTKRSAA